MQDLCGPRGFNYWYVKEKYATGLEFLQKALSWVMFIETVGVKLRLQWSPLKDNDSRNLECLQEKS
jgi:hypothetical protein